MPKRIYIYNLKFTFLLLTVFILLANTLIAQDNSQVLQVDSLEQKKTTEIVNPKNSTTDLANDTLSTDSVKIRKDADFDAEISYSGSDSIVFFGNGLGLIYGDAKLNFKEMNLSEASHVRIRMDSTTVHAYSNVDSTGNVVHKPIFKDSDSEYVSNQLSYNFKSKKGFAGQAVTIEGDGYIISKNTKMIQNEILNMADGKYTTCELHDHPHFYLSMSKAKVKPGNYVVFGPANLVLLDIPLPVALPFGFFPFNTNYSSGIEMPSFNTEFTRGYGLTNGGYYFAINDYADLSIKGDIYTKGTWGVNLASKYLKRYKFNGGINISYRVDVIGEKGLPEYNKSNNLSISWSHSQNPKVNPFRTFSASVNFSTSGYNRSNINSYYSPVNAENTKSSTISFSQRFPTLPFTVSGNLGVNQRTKDSTISLTLPNISISMSRINPLKRKNRIGKERWYEKFTMSYSGTMSNSITTKENLLFQSSFKNDWRNGMQHSIPISASFTLLDYITITPSFNYKERWYLYETEREWDVDAGRPVDIRKDGFKRVYDFNTSVSANTTLYGLFTPNQKVFGDKIVAIRHKLDPSVSFGYSPDFGDPQWGYWDSYRRSFVNPNDDSQMMWEEVHYSRFERSLYGGPGRGKNGSLSFSLANNLEMKVRNDKDTTETNATKIISLIDQFSLGSAYNLAADSMQWSNINANLRIKFGKSRSINLSGAFDPYMYGVGPDGKSVRRINQLRWNNGKFPRFLGTSMSYSYTINNNTFKKKEKKDQGRDTNPSNDLGDEEGRSIDNDPNFNADRNRTGQNRRLEDFDRGEDGYEKVTIPWNISVNYSVRFGDGNVFDYDRMEYNRKFTHNLSFNGNLQLTPGWKIAGTTSYDFAAKQFTYTNFNVTRDLHCWTLTGSFVPFGRYQTYSFRIGVNSSMLSDLKYEKQGSRSGMNNITWY